MSNKVHGAINWTDLVNQNLLCKREREKEQWIEKQYSGICIVWWNTEIKKLNVIDIEHIRNERVAHGSKIYAVEKFQVFFFFISFATCICICWIRKYVAVHLINVAYFDYIIISVSSMSNDT